MRSTIIGLAVALLGAGCGGSDDSGTPAPGGSDASTDAASESSTDAASDAVADVATEAGPWDCVGHVVWPTATVSTIDLTFTMQENGTGNPAVGAAMKACAKDDAACATPLATGTADANGAVTFVALPIPTTGFDGYVEVSGTGLLTSLTYLAEPLVASTTIHQSMPSPATLASMAQAVGATLDPTRGHVAVRVHDCAWDGNAEHGAAGVTVAVSTADASSRTGYFVHDVPSLTATSTDAYGLVGVVNVPVGTATVTATAAGASSPFGTADVVVRAGAITAKSLVPTP